MLFRSIQRTIFIVNASIIMHVFEIVIFRDLEDGSDDDEEVPLECLGYFKHLGYVAKKYAMITSLLVCFAEVIHTWVQESLEAVNLPLPAHLLHSSTPRTLKHAWQNCCYNSKQRQQ